MLTNITPDKIARFLIGVAAAFLILLILLHFSNLVAYAVIAVLLSYLLDPIVNRLQAAGMNRTAATTLTLATLVLVIAWISTSIFPIIAGQMAALLSQLSFENLRFILAQIENQLIENFEFLTPGFLQDNIMEATQNLFEIGEIPNVVSDLIGIFTNIFYAVIVIPFATFFFLKDGSRIRRDLLQLVPNKYFESALSLIDKIETRLGRYFRSVLIQSILVATFAWIFLSIAGLSNAPAVGIAIGVANTIPYFGPVLGYLLSIIVPIIETGDFTLIIPCVLAVLLVQILDNIVFQPMLFSRAAEMHPVAILFIIMIGAQVAGILGMLVAVPLATIVKITFEQVVWSFNNYNVFRVDSLTGIRTDAPGTLEEN